MLLDAVSTFRVWNLFTRDFRSAAWTAAYSCLARGAATHYPGPTSPLSGVLTLLDAVSKFRVQLLVARSYRSAVWTRSKALALIGVYLARRCSGSTTLLNAVSTSRMQCGIAWVRGDAEARRLLHSEDSPYLDDKRILLVLSLVSPSSLIATYLVAP